MPARTVLHYADQAIALGELGNVFLTVLRQQSTMAGLRELRRHLSRFHGRWPGAVTGLTVFGEGSFAFNVSSEIRQESTRIARDFQSVAASIVVETSGFAGSALRAFLSGMALAAGNKAKTHASVAEGATWLAPRASPLAKETVLASEITQAVEELRVAIKAQ